jgi:hypothetical protein
MRKLKVVGVALVALFAIGVVVASSASAVTFLLAGFLTTGGVSQPEGAISTTGELLLEDNKVPLLGHATILCSGILHGLILGATEPSHIEILSVLSLGNVAINTTPLVEEGLLCTNQANCPEPLVWAVHLPWLGELELVVDGTEEFFSVLILNSGAGNPGWEVNCMGASLTDTCEAAEGIAKQTNVAGGVEGEFSEAFTLLAGLPLATCSLGGIGSGVVASEGGAGLTTLDAGGTLTISSLE